MLEKKNDSNGADESAALERLLAQSAGTDVPLLLQAKEMAKQAVKRDPSSGNLSALERATKMLEAAMTVNESGEGPEIFKNVGAVLAYLDEAGRQIKKTKLYADIRKGLLKKQNNNFRKRDVDRYASSLPLATTPDGRSEAAAERLRRREEAEIRIKEASAAREELRTSILQGKYVLRDQVDQELAARAVALNTGIKSQLEAASLDLIITVNGKPEMAHPFTQALETIVDAACNEYAQLLDFEVDLSADDDSDTDELNESGDDS